MRSNERPTWTILIATLGQRADRFKRLIDILTPQLEANDGLATVLAYPNNGEKPLGQIRQTLVESARSDFVSFVDDDDTVPHYFVSEVLDAIGGRLTAFDALPDYVGWQLQCYSDGVPLKPTYHSLRYTSWWDDEHGYYRDISHLNPIRRAIALRADFRRGEPPEDVSWADQVRGHVRSEVYIDRVMYHYHASSTDSTWRPGSVMPTTQRIRVPLTSPFISYITED